MKNLFKCMSVALLCSWGSGAAAGEALDRIRAKGSLSCGLVPGLPGVVEPNEAQQAGFAMAICNAVATVIFSDSGAAPVEQVTTTPANQFADLQAGKFDLLVNAPQDLPAQVQFGLRHQALYFDQIVPMIPKFIDGVFSLRELHGAEICVIQGSQAEAALELAITQWRADLQVQGHPDYASMVAAYSAEQCQGIVDHSLALTSLRNHARLPFKNKIMADFLGDAVSGLAARQQDHDLANVVSATVSALLLAESQSLSRKYVNLKGENELDQLSSKARRLSALSADLGLHPDWIYKLLITHGNYSDLFNGSIGPETAMGLQRGVNALWQDGGLQFPEG